MQFDILPHVPMPELMGNNNIIKLLPTAAYDRLDRTAVRLWCHQNARYGLPTVELIAWLKHYINGRSALEIGSGAGDLAHHLGITATDSKIQNDPIAAIYYRMHGQPTIHYPVWVEKLEALAAIEKYRPTVVLASWVTNWIDPHKPPPPGGGSIFGVHEDQLLKTGVTYVFIGNLNVHQYKPICRLPHQELHLPFVRSRASDPSLDRILIWNA